MLTGYLEQGFYSSLCGTYSNTHCPVYASHLYKVKIKKAVNPPSRCRNYKNKTKQNKKKRKRKKEKRQKKVTDHVSYYLNSITRLSSIHKLVMHQQANSVWSSSIWYLIRGLLKSNDLLISESDIYTHN